MSEHYYTKTPRSVSDRKRIEAVLRGRRLAFATDAGVFSKSGVDFGSRLLIETADIPDGARVLDVGCGYGPIGLAIAAARPSAHVTMIDINERAVKLARENAERNGIRNVTILESDLFEAVRDQTFDAVLTNPPIRAGKAVVHRIFEEAFERLVPGGALWVVIQKKQGAPSAEAKLEEIFGADNVRMSARDKGYCILRAERSNIC
ncbi:16S RNA G1207 methylase RsmC [Thermobacillus composti KWC4]|uniref:16S RNA G1207 methylase RsmC n=1 Tax=Thermobacillus composti (strain DSM 18247 / JCM 13945 / KWC4) TaxID=717605 RepID=L0EA39_THECK|nr:class I SAM-dependent methyltransferase [Thermobacillus composti]AGA56514.1 16S RNA G1207 methylase RsmC [Thermobacillus composti KWC4]